MIFARDDQTGVDPKPTALYGAVASTASANSWTSINGFVCARAYSTVADEYDAAMNDAAIADFGAVIRYTVRGPDAGALIGKATSVPALALEPGESARGLMLDDGGFVVDLVEAARLSRDLYLLAASQRHARRLQLCARGFAATVEEITGNVAALGILGPRAREAAAEAGLDLAGEAAAQRRVRGVEISARIVQFGAVAGVEIIYPYEDALTLWERLRRRRALKPIGLDALEIIRIEGGTPRPGVDFIGADDTISDTTARRPDELGLEHLAATDRAWFNGRRALTDGAARRRLAVLKIDADEAAVGAGVYVKKGAAGRLTSVAFSPRMKQIVAIADLSLLAAGKPLEVALAGEPSRRVQAIVMETRESRLALAFKLATEKRSSSV